MNKIAGENILKIIEGPVPGKRGPVTAEIQLPDGTTRTIALGPVKSRKIAEEQLESIVESVVTHWRETKRHTYIPFQGGELQIPKGLFGAKILKALLGHSKMRKTMRVIKEVWSKQPSELIAEISSLKQHEISTAKRKKRTFAFLGTEEGVDIGVVGRRLGAGMFKRVTQYNFAIAGALARGVIDPKKEGAVETIEQEQEVLKALSDLPHVLNQRFLTDIKTGHVGTLAEVCSHGTLDRIFDELPFATQLRLLRQAAEGLNNVHHHNVCHLDVKQENIFVTENENGDLEALIGDFGLSLVTGTKISGYQGTPGYIAPEMLRKGKKTSTGKMDVFSFGVTLFCLWTGKPYLFNPCTSPKGKSMEGVAHSGERERALNAVKTMQKACRTNGDIVKSELYELIARCVSFEPEKRPTMEQVALTLKQLEATDRIIGDAKERFRKDPESFERVLTILDSNNSMKEKALALKNLVMTDRVIRDAKKGFRKNPKNFEPILDIVQSGDFQRDPASAVEKSGLTDLFLLRQGERRQKAMEKLEQLFPDEALDKGEDANIMIDQLTSLLSTL